MKMNSSFPPPLFILAAPRSFTSLICAMLGQHPQAYGVPELNLFIGETLQDITEVMPSIRQLRRHGILRMVSQVYFGGQNLMLLESARRWVLKRNYWSVGEVYQELCRQVAPKQIIDKSPRYSFKPEYLQRIHQTFPDAYYLHLTRHPRSQGKSILNIFDGLLAIMGDSMDNSSDIPLVDPQYMWYNTQHNILDFLSNIPDSHHRHFRGEDILSDPPRYFEEICRWLNLDWNSSAFEAMLQPQNSPYACLGPYGAHYGNDSNFLKSPTFSQRTISPSYLEGPLPWRPDGKGFILDVVEMAQRLGYE
jgi:hypothetical protein